MNNLYTIVQPKNTTIKLLKFFLQINVLIRMDSAVGPSL